MIDRHFTITLEQYLDAQTLYMRQEMKRKRWLRWLLSFIVLFSVTTVFLTNPSGFFADHAYLIGFLVIPLVLLFPGPLQRRTFKKRFEKEKQNLTNAHVVIDQQGYHTDIPGIGSGVANWSGMNSWHEGKHVIILRSGLLMRIVPKDRLSAVELDELHSLLTSNIGPVDVVK